MGVAVALFSAACEYDPTILDGPLGDCGGDTANRGYGYDPNRDPAGGSSYSGSSASDVIIAANGPVRISAGAGHDVICANPLGRTSSVVIDAGPGLDDCRNVSGVTTSGCEFVDGIPNVNAVNTALGRGINLGNILEAPREGAWGLELEAGFFTKIAQQGFTHVRVPISWAGYARSTPPYDIPDDNDPTIAHPDYDSIFERVDWVIEQADATGLIAIINMPGVAPHRATDTVR